MTSFGTKCGHTTKVLLQHEGHNKNTNIYNKFCNSEIL